MVDIHQCSMHHISKSLLYMKLSYRYCRGYSGIERKHQCNVLVLGGLQFYGSLNEIIRLFNVNIAPLKSQFVNCPHCLKKVPFLKYQEVAMPFRDLAAECYWLGCLMALASPPLQPDWESLIPGPDAWNIFPSHLLLSKDTEPIEQCVDFE